MTREGSAASLTRLPVRGPHEALPSRCGRGHPCRWPVARSMRAPATADECRLVRPFPRGGCQPPPRPTRKTPRRHRAYFVPSACEAEAQSEPRRFLFVGQRLVHKSIHTPGRFHMAQTHRGRCRQKPLPLADLRQGERIGRRFAVGALAIGDPAYLAGKRFGIPRPRLYRTGQLAVQADCAVWPVNGHSPTTAHELCFATPSS
jgi:hypothetical protein